jgi:hypothetical protein
MTFLFDLPMKTRIIHLNLSPKRAVKRKSTHRTGGAMRPAQNILNMRDYTSASAIDPVPELLGWSDSEKVPGQTFVFTLKVPKHENF